MLAAANVQPGDIVLEVGPGPGTLTSKLVRSAREVVAVELDEALARDLPGRVQAANGEPAANLTIVRQNILRFDLTTLPADYKVVANIPYYLTSALMQNLCESANPPARAALLVQKEVAERVCAGPGGMSLLSVSVQAYMQASLGLLVPAELFTPPPKVDSQILILQRRERPLFEELEPRFFFRVVKAGFAQRRKTLLNSLSAGLRLSRGETVTLLERAGIEPDIRAQNLDLADWLRLARCAPKL